MKHNMLKWLLDHVMLKIFKVKKVPNTIFKKLKWSQKYIQLKMEQ